MGQTMIGENRMLRQGAYLLPNLLTSFSLLCGLVAIVLCLEYLTGQKVTREGNPLFTSAAWLIIASMVFDFLDGKVARWVHAESEFGVKIDSLADFVSFGIAPVVLAYTALLPYVPLPVQGVACCAYLFGGAWRLARFNCEDANCAKSSVHFTGLPIPAAATFICSLVLINPGVENGGAIFLGRSFTMLPPGIAGILSALLLLLLAFLMMSRIPFPAFKKTNRRNLILFGGVAIFILVLMLVLPLPNIVFLIMVLYLCFGLFQNFLDRVLKLQNQTSLNIKPRAGANKPHGQ
jgi:CDP-diacylglycerol--serine O-phosphatidyltransferase